MGPAGHAAAPRLGRRRWLALGAPVWPALLLVLAADRATGDASAGEPAPGLGFGGFGEQPDFGALFAKALPALDAGAAQAAAHAAAQLSERYVSEGVAALGELSAQLERHGASLKQAAHDSFARLSEQSAICATCAVQSMKDAVAGLEEQRSALVLAAGQAAVRLVEQEAELKHAALQAATQLAEKISGSPVGEQHKRMQAKAREAVKQLSKWQSQAKSAASQTAAQLAEGVAERQAALTEAAAHAARRLAEPRAALRSAIAEAGAHLSERQGDLAQAVASTAAQLQSSGEETLRQASETASRLLQEHERLLRESSALIRGLADMQATLSPSAGRVSVQLAELQRLVALEHRPRPGAAGAPWEACAAGGNASLAASASADGEAAPAPKAFAYQWFLALKAHVEALGVEVPLACSLLCVSAVCLCSTAWVVTRGGGEDTASLGHGQLLLRAACWGVHRATAGWALVLLSARLAEAPLHIRKYDSFGWPLWSTLLPCSSQFLFFIPAAVLLNGAVAQRSRVRYGSPRIRRFYASLSREVHAAICGCFVSDWCLFPTDLIFFMHHLLGLGIIFGVWSMVLREARSRPCSAEEPTTIHFWWVTGLSIATMEASSFFYNLYSLVAFGDVLKLSLFAAFTYSNVLSIICVIAWHPWGASVKVIWWAGGQISDAIEGAQTALARPPMQKLSAKGVEVSASYIIKGLMVAAICAARQSQMWEEVRGQTSRPAVALVGASCVLAAAACAWRLRDF